MVERTIKETTQTQLSNHLVGVGNIWERKLPDEHGVIAPRLSATLSIQDLDSKAERHERVFAGVNILLGADRYEVVRVEEGQTEPGSITLRQVT